MNRTQDRWSDDQCFWSLNSGREWHSFAKEPATPCPTGNGRVYFRLGPAPKDLNDREAYWDFIEYAYGGGTWHGNTTQVDAFCVPLTIQLGDKKAGIQEARGKLFRAFLQECPKEFRGCVKGDKVILSPAKAGFDKRGPYADYFAPYVDEIWKMYASPRPTPGGGHTGEIVDGALRFTPVRGGKAISCAKKPTTQEILLGEGVLGKNPAFCAAFHRHVAADPADWRTPAKFYQANPCNWYSKFFHEHSIDHKSYGFCYDDASEQAAFFSGQGDALVVTLGW